MRLYRRLLSPDFDLQKTGGAGAMRRRPGRERSAWSATLPMAAVK
jgi:hypothetical protein